MAVYGYVRVSTGRQVEDGESLDVQERTIRGYAMMKGLDEPTFFREEGVSGSKPFMTRPAGASLLDAVRPGDVIVGAKLDRMFRSAIDALAMLERFRRDRIGLHLIDLGGDVGSDMVAKLVFTILAAVAEAERERIRERISDVKSDQAKRGRYLGGTVPFGWRSDDDGLLVPVPAEQHARARIIERRATGWSLRQIAAELAADGMTLSHVGVRRVLEQEAARVAAE